MNKIVFQLGLLGFCVSAVVFGGSGGSVLDIVSRAFIVFVGIVIAAVVVLFIASTMVQNSIAHKAADNAAESTQTHNTKQQERTA